MSVPGRVRVKLAGQMSLLSHSTLATRTQGRITREYTCEPENLWPARGAWRTNMLLDVVPWSGHATRSVTYWAHGERDDEVISERVGVCSWFTMTKLTRPLGFAANPHTGRHGTRWDGELVPVCVDEDSAARVATRWNRKAAEIEGGAL